jgi:glycosyltransferase involved in cell wall biosynthesis
LPGGGGIDRDLFRPGEPSDLPMRESIRDLLRSIPVNAPVVINPRGFRAYVRNDTFFRSLERILEHHPGTHFLMPGMAGESRARAWLQQPRLRESAHPLPKLAATEMAALYRRSWVVVSPSEHDGTPNTFLEAIASGCFPVVGDLESLREWVEPGSNGELIDPGDPEQLANAVCVAIEEPRRLEQAQVINQALIDKRAERSVVTVATEDFYHALLESDLEG